MFDDPCGVCGFDSSRYTAKQDVLGTLRSFGLWWQWAVAGVESVPAVEALTASAADELARLARIEVASIGAAAMALHDGDFSPAVRVAAAHVGIHHLSAIGRAVAAAGAGPTPAYGVVAQVNASGGGVPKAPVDHAPIGFGGLEGDKQAARKHHGRPWQAVSLWSADVIAALAEEGHPIGPGCAGENITVSDVEWAAMRPGVRLQVGTALLETSAYAIPCTKNAQWFVGGNFNRMHHDLHPGWSRIYASVLEPGEVRPGDPFVIEP